jgi:hypothetical protein
VALRLLASRNTHSAIEVPLPKLLYPKKAIARWLTAKAAIQASASI